MSLKEKVKFLWKKKNVTGFKGFKDYLFIFLNLSGFNVLEDEFFTGYFRKFLIIFTAILPITGFFTSFRVIWLYFDQVEEVIVSTVSWIMTFQAANKLIELAVHRKNHRRMIEIVLKNTESMQDNREFFKIGVKNYNRARFYITITTFAYLSALVSLWSYPFFPLLTRGEFKLAANVEWPGTNHLEGKGWAFNYVYSLVLTGSVAFLVLAYDIIFYLYVFYITGRFDILGNQFQLIGDFTSSYNTEEKQRDLLVNCVKIHTDILAFARKCSELFSTVYLFVSLSDFVIICIALFHLQLDIFASTGFMGIAAVVQNFVFSNCGQIVRTASEEASIALYNSNWHQLKRIDQRKMILLMLTQSQKEVGFTAGGYPVSLELFMNVGI